MIEKVQYGSPFHHQTCSTTFTRSYQNETIWENNSSVRGHEFCCITYRISPDVGIELPKCHIELYKTQKILHQGF